MASLVVHSYQVAAPSQLHLPQHGMDAEDSLTRWPLHRSCTCLSMAWMLRIPYQVATPSQLHLPQHGVDAEDSGPLRDFHSEILSCQLGFSILRRQLKWK
ncbi:unnamed protein product [Schistocephalus solidus]|uniref:Uncharacterized protein n=1 Tax=Schistocephalus solidus TaxID=70667 RepID=A0A183T5Z2_SCHSO|nr:unnamed protein product [Schistocephalus solidus]